MRSLSRMLRATTDRATSFCASAFSVGAMLSACSSFLVTVSSAISWCKTPIAATLLDRHADLELHLLDDSLAQGGHVRLLDPVDPWPARPGPAPGRPGCAGAWRPPPVWASAATLSNIKQPAATAAIGFETDMIGRASSPPGCCRVVDPRLRIVDHVQSSGLSSQARVDSAESPELPFTQCRNGQRNSTDS